MLENVTVKFENSYLDMQQEVKMFHTRVLIVLSALFQIALV